MNLKEYIRAFKVFLKQEEQHKLWLDSYTKESSSTGFNKALKHKIKTRDGWKCQECRIEARQLRQMQSYLTIHHIDFNHENNKPENLITLCPLCHAKTNFQQSSWIKYYMEKTGFINKQDSQFNNNPPNSLGHRRKKRR